MRVHPAKVEGLRQSSIQKHGTDYSILKHPSYIESVAVLGVPILEDAEIVVPVGDHLSSFIEIPDYSDEAPERRSMLAALPVAVRALRGLGIPLDFADTRDVVGELLTAMFQSTNQFKNLECHHASAILQLSIHWAIKYFAAFSPASLISF